jgi:hypothetical protein
VQVFVRAGNDLHTDDFANPAGGVGSGVRGGPTLSQPKKLTFAAFIIASLASTRATKPLVSIIPSASNVFDMVD